jgi:hypothetical protein
MALLSATPQLSLFLGRLLPPAGGGGVVQSVAVAANRATAAVASSSALLAVRTDGRISGGGPALQALGYAIVVAAALVRLPQAWRAWRDKEPPAGLHPLSAEVEMFFYVVQVLNGLRLKLPVHAWADSLCHAVMGGAMTLMLYAYAKPRSTQAVSTARKATTLALLAACERPSERLHPASLHPVGLACRLPLTV